MQRVDIRRSITMAIAMVLSLIARAQDIIVTPAEATAAAGMMSVGSTDGIYVINPSMMSQVSRAAVHISYVMPYGINELGQISGKGVVATKLANVGMQVSQSGNEDSHYTEIGGGLSRSFGKWGMGLEYHALIHTLTDNQRYTSSFSRIGVHFNPNERWLLSVAAQGIERREIDYGYTTVVLEPTCWAALKWKGSDLFSLMLEAEKRWDRDAVIKAAAAIYPIDGLDITVGFSSKGQSLSAGAGYAWRGIGIHVGVMHHEQLGVTSGASVSYNFTKR